MCVCVCFRVLKGVLRLSKLDQLDFATSDKCDFLVFKTRLRFDLTASASPLVFLLLRTQFLDFSFLTFFFGFDFWWRIAEC